MHVTGDFNWSVSVSIIKWSVSVSIFDFSFLFYCYQLQVSSYRYVSPSVSKLRSLERGGVSEPSKDQVDR
jgi:hypothetical protein